MTNIPKINTLKFLGVISKNKYGSLLCSSNGKFCGLALNNKYQIVFDSSSDLIMLYKNNNYDKSDKVLDLMGY